MISLKKITILFTGLASASQAFADWESANLEEEIQSSGIYRTCIYESTSGYRFSIQNRGFCPLIVQVDPETGRVKK